MQTIADLRYASAVLQWDQETYLPPKGVRPVRGQQIATLAEIAHKYFTDDKLGARLPELLSGDKLSAEEKRNGTYLAGLLQTKRNFLPHFVRTLAEAVNKSFHSWMEARKANDFSHFANDLARLLN